MEDSTNRLSTLLDELQALLAEERTALLEGGPERICTVATRKLALAAEIEQQTPAALLPEADRLSRLARTNRQNGVICSAMLRHMVRVLDRLRAHEPHRSYQSDGSERERPARRTLGAA